MEVWESTAGLACSPFGCHSRAMLILSRKVGQSIVINGNVVVKVVRVDGDQIKLGIQAPESVKVNREEIQRQQDAGIPPGGVSALKSALGLSD
jgi:carbon storage regulator